MIYGYLAPLSLIALFFVAVSFLMDGLARISLYILLVMIPLLPFYLLYNQEVTDKNREKLRKKN